MRQGMTVHHNGPPANCIGQGHDRCHRFWLGVKAFHTRPKSEGGQGWSDIAYSFGICPHGERFTGRGWNKSQFANGSDDVGQDDDADGPWYSVLMFVGGGYMEEGKWVPSEKPTLAMTNALDELIIEGRSTDRMGDRVEPHSKWKRKACPGPEFTVYCTIHNNKPYVTKGWDEMASKDEIKAALREVLREAEFKDIVQDEVVKAFEDKPGKAVGKVMARLEREFEAPTSTVRKAVMNAMKEDLNLGVTE